MFFGKNAKPEKKALNKTPVTGDKRTNDFHQKRESMTKPSITKAKNSKSSSCAFAFSQPFEGSLLLTFSGTWTTKSKLPPSRDMVAPLSSEPGIHRISFETKDLSDWDSIFLSSLYKIIGLGKEAGMEIDKDGLPDGVRRLLALMEAVPEKKGVRKEKTKSSFLTRVGAETLDFVQSSGDILAFLGEVFLSFLRLLRGKARFRRSDLALVMQDCGIQALPIVSLISLLVGLILGFVGAVQLVMFGAQIYVANLVAIAIVRVMGAIMAGIIMAGRTGAAFAAQLGTMQVNEEIDAFKTMGISPMDFLVLPRLIGLTLMMPLLVLYADLMGILGGMIVGVGMLDLNIMQYYLQTKASVTLYDLSIGVFQGMVFGVLVAVAGCLRGMQCGRSASSVGDAATSAVVTGIVSIIVATAVITVICNVLGI